MTSTAPLIAASDSLSLGGARGLITVVGTLAFVAACFGLVELLDRRSSNAHGAAAASFSPPTPAADTHKGSSLHRESKGSHDRANLDQALLASAVGGLAAVLVAAGLKPLRESIGQASVALALVLVVTAAAAAGGRVAASITSAVAALSFNPCTRHRSTASTSEARRTW